MSPQPTIALKPATATLSLKRFLQSLVEKPRVACVNKQAITKIVSLQKTKQITRHEICGSMNTLLGRVRLTHYGLARKTPRQ